MKFSDGKRTIAPGAASVSTMTDKSVPTQPKKTQITAVIQCLIVIDMFKLHHAILGLHCAQTFSKLINFNHY